MTEGFVGEIRLFAGNFNPQNWALCNGQNMSIAQNDVLFSLIGTTYGGDGIQTFKLPDFRGRVPVGQGQGQGLTQRTIGEASGTETCTVLSSQMPSHTHPVAASAANATSTAPGPLMLYGAMQPAGAISGLYTNATAGGAVVQLDTRAISNAGSSQPHDNMMVTTCISFIMALEGIYPQRPN